MMTATRLRNYLLTFSVLLLVMQWAAFSAQAQISVTTCGTMITQPGKYTLANDLLQCPGDGIVIRSAGVSLNLNGHQITGPAHSSTHGIQVTLPPNEWVIIDGPGTIANFGTGLELDLAHGRAFIVSVTAQQNRFGFMVLNGSNITLGNNTAVNNIVIGFALYDTDDSSLVESSANANGDGIVILGSRNEIILNTANNNAKNGIVAFSGGHNRISTNTALGNSRYDLYQLGQDCNNTWVNNTFNSANLPCIH
jgi:parallel beta-helix repeat protein